MRVLYLTLNPNRQSTTVPTEGWFRLLRPMGLEPVLVSSQSGEFQAWARAEGIPVYHQPLPFPDKRAPIPFLKALWACWRIARRHRVQLVHCNEQDVYPIGQYVARLLGVPAVVSVHFAMGPEFVRWAFGGRKCPSRMFFVSRSSLERCRPVVQPVVPESRWRVLYNGLDLVRFRPDDAMRAAFRAEHGLGDAPVIGVACALRPRKQLEHLFEAAARSNVPRLRVLVAGGPVPGDEAYADGLVQRAKELLGDRLLLLGHLTELRPFYNALDLFVNTSQEEACSISVIESLSCGCPVVGYASASVDEQILPGGGEVVPQDSVAALSEALTRWIGDPNRLANARTGARQRAESTFDVVPLAEQVWREYFTVL